MNQSFDYFGMPELPYLILCNPNKEQLYALGVAYEMKIVQRFNAMSEFNFIFPESIDGGATLIEAYAYLENKRLVLVEGYGYFQIVNVEENRDGSIPIKAVSCMSIENELVSKRVVGFGGTVKLYDALSPYGTILNTMITLAPSWSIGDIDGELMTKFRTFSVSDSNIYEFLMNDVAKAFECVFFFDMTDKTISATGSEAFVPAVMEHIELAGVHSGDSACIIPPVSIAPEHVATIEEYTRRLAVELGVVGLINVQYAIADGKVYILEANPRASRTVPIVSKVCALPMARIAAQVMLGAKLRDLGLRRRQFDHFGVKEAVFPFYMFPEVDPVLGPEMRSTGEVLGMAASDGLAFFKAQQATRSPLPLEGTVLITVADPDKQGILEAAREFARLGFRLLATSGTRDFLARHDVPAELVSKLHEGRPNLVDAIKNGEVQLLVNTPAGKRSAHDDSHIRKAAIRAKVPYITTAAAALVSARGIAARRAGADGVRSLQEYHAAMR